MFVNDWGVVLGSVLVVDMLVNICKGYSYFVGKIFFSLDFIGLSFERLVDLIVFYRVFEIEEYGRNVDWV